jgi:hypothetical protein
VHLAKEVEAIETFPPVRLETASGIMDIVVDEHLPQKIRAARKNLFPYRIPPLDAPTGNNIIAFIELREEEWDIRRIILQISIHRDNDIARRPLESRVKRGALSEIPTKRDERQRRKLSALLKRRVSRAVIHENNLEGAPPISRALP